MALLGKVSRRFMPSVGLQNINSLSKVYPPKIGLIPIFGGFHDGYTEIIKTSQKECDFVAVSLNTLSTQLTHKKYNIDLSGLYKYNIKKFIELGVSHIYVSDIKNIKYFTYSCREKQKHSEYLTELCVVLNDGIRRINPDYVYYQYHELDECREIVNMINFLKLPTQLRLTQPYRYNNNTVASVRNYRLSDIEFKESSAIYDCLNTSIQTYKSPHDIKRSLHENILKYNFIKNEPEISITTFPSLNEIEEIIPNNPFTVSVEVQIGNGILKDNITSWRV